MIIGITGHTKGICKSLSDIFQKNNYETVGFSRSLGYDIGDMESRDDILKKVENFDIFINNAYHPTGQLEMLKSIIELWKHTNKIVINISSQIIYKPVYDYDQGQLLPCNWCHKEDCDHCSIVIYKKSKKDLNNYINGYTGSVRILNVIPDVTNTNFHLIPKNWDRNKFMNVDDLANLVFDVIKYEKKFFIKELNINGNFNSRF